MEYMPQSYLYGNVQTLPIEQQHQQHQHQHQHQHHQQLAHGIPIQAVHPHHHVHHNPHQLFGFDPFYGQHVPADFAHNFYHAVTLEDTESLSRPRLTKEQVDTLEAQFQAHPKPNSSVKRQLAMQTNLTLPRVANWFQNRRAKAKQQKRQAEYEKKLAEEKAEKEGKAAGAGTAGTATSEEPQQSTALAASGQDAAAASRATPVSDGKPSMDKEEVKTIHESDTQAHTHTQQQAHARTPDLAESRIDISPQMLHSATQAEHPKRHEATVAAACVSGQQAADSLTTTTSVAASAPAPAVACDAAKLPPQWQGLQRADPQGRFASLPLRESWQMPSAASMPAEMMNLVPMPFTPILEDRECDSLTATMATPAASTTLPTPSVQISPMAPPMPNTVDTWRQYRKEVDIAARRKRPRPAAIGTASIGRGHSAGPTSVSPTLGGVKTSHHGNHGMQPQLLRQTKSTQSLGRNGRARLAGIRKSTYTTRSPMNLSTFNENTLLASALPAFSPLTTPMTPDGAIGFIPPATSSSYAYSVSDCPTYATAPRTGSSHGPDSPPVTPYNLDSNMPRSSLRQHSSLVALRSAPPHQMAFADDTAMMMLPNTTSTAALGVPVSSYDCAWSGDSSLSPETPQVHGPQLAYLQGPLNPDDVSQMYTCDPQSATPALIYDQQGYLYDNSSMLQGSHPFSPEGTIKPTPQLRHVGHLPYNANITVSPPHGLI